MNSFSDLLASDARPLTLRLRLRAITEAGWPRAVVSVNGETIYNDVIESSWTCCRELPLLEPVSVQITLQDKIYDQHRETALIVDELEIDYWNVIPQFAHLVTYQHDHGIGPSGAYLGFNGTWHWQTHRPFYQWWHDVSGQGWLLEPQKSRVDLDL